MQIGLLFRERYVRTFGVYENVLVFTLFHGQLASAVVHVYSYMQLKMCSKMEYGTFSKFDNKNFSTVSPILSFQSLNKLVPLSKAYNMVIEIHSKVSVYLHINIFSFRTSKFLKEIVKES